MKYLVKGLYWLMNVLKWALMIFLCMIFIITFAIGTKDQIDTVGVANFLISLGWALSGVATLLFGMIGVMFLYEHVQEKYREIKRKEKQEKKSE